MKDFPKKPIAGVGYYIKGVGLCYWSSVTGWRVSK